jgi:pimeloyl-ACP methyl ester carboxylesterase
VYVTVNGVKLHVLAWGDPKARAVLMVHGMRGHARWWSPVGPAVGERFYALSVDLRGHGDSEHAPESEHDAFVADVAALPDALGLSRPILIGHSMGGSVALRAAVSLGERLAGLVLVDAGLGLHAPPWQRLWWRLRLGLQFGRPPVPPARAPVGSRVYATREEAMARFKLRPGDTVIRPELLRHLAEHAVRELPDGTFTWRFDPALRPGRPRGIRRLARPDKLRVPVVLIYGDKSPIKGRSDIRHICDIFTRAPWKALEVVPEAYHHVFLDQPDAFNALLLPHLLRIDREAAPATLEPHALGPHGRGARRV